MANRSTYTWVHKDGVGVASCVTVVAGIGPDEALRRFGADTSRTLDVEIEAEDAANLGVRRRLHLLQVGIGMLLLVEIHFIQHQNGRDVGGADLG